MKNLVSFLIVYSFCFLRANAQDIYALKKDMLFKNPNWIKSSSEIKLSKKHKNRENLSLVRISLDGSKPIKEAIKELQNIPNYIWVEEVVPYQTFETAPFSASTPNDPDRATFQPWLETLQASAAWEIGTGSSDIVIAIIDTGVELNHPDLEANLWVNAGEIPGNGIDDDQNGFIDDINGWDFFSKTGDPNPKSNSNNHGTHVAGLASAVTNNGIGIASLSYNTRFMPIKISDNNGKNLSYGYEAIIYAVNNGANVINCSWGSTQFSKALEFAIEYAWENGVIVTAAAGNDGNTSVYYPAGYARSIAVGSINFKTLKKSSFSNYGGFVDVLAPGGETNDGIYSTLTNKSYGVSSGTSMASPIVASLVGLIKSVRPDWDKSTVRAQLEKTALSVKETNPDIQNLIGTGLIQAQNALSESLKPLTKLMFYHFGDSNNVANVFNRNQLFDLFLKVEQYGSTDNTIGIQVSSLSPYLTVLDNASQTISLVHNQTKTAQKVKVQVSPDAPANTKANLKIEFIYSDQTKTAEIIEIKAVPDNLIHDVNSIHLGVNGTGRIGYFNYPTNSQGLGFVIKENGTTQSNLKNTPLLKEAGLLFGNGGTRISSSVRGVSNQVDNEFFLVDYFESSFDAANGIQKGKALFTDLNAGIEGLRFDILTTLETFAQTSDLDSDYILFKYTFKNTHPSATYSTMRAALFFDFDMPFNDADNDVTFHDRDNDFMAQFSGGLETDTTLYVGASILEGIYSPWIIDNNSTSSFYFGINSAAGGFSDEEKWLAMDGRAASMLDSRKRIGPSNNSFVISTSAFNLAPEQEQSFTFILGYGIGYSALSSTMLRAKQKAPLVTSIDENLVSVPESFKILGNSPNPFNPTTQIFVEIPKAGLLNYALYDVLGREVFSTKSQFLSQGIHQIHIDGSALSSGIYIVRVFMNQQVHSHKIMLVK